ncbi:MAG TPA: lipopolysaccharide biosynthesis protein [Gemmatimonadales bacterium]|nr:lipopolysaccharide biosynthesis protein [Gemmatimonadales bacterium]
MTGGNKPSLTHHTVAGIFWLSYGKAAFFLLQLIVVGVLARLVTPTAFGVVNAALIVTGFSAIVSQLGLGPALVQRPTLERRHIDTAYTFSFLFGLSLGAMLYFGAPLAASFLRMPDVIPVLQALALVFPLNGLQTVGQSLLSRDLHFSWLANLDVVSYGVGFGIIGIVAALLGAGVWALVLAQIGQSLGRTVVLLWKHPPRLRFIFDGPAFRDLAYFGGGFTLARVANYIAVNGDNFIVGRFLGAAPLGYYGRAYSLMAAPAYAFGTVLDQVLFPAMAKVQDDVKRLGAAYRRGVALIALVVLPASVVIIFLAPEVIRVALGPKWGPAVLPFQVLGLGMLFRTSYKMSDSISRSTGAVYRRAWRQLIYGGLVVLGAWIGTHWGIVGVSWGALAALSVNFFLMAALGQQVAGLKWSTFWKAHQPAVLLTLVSFPLVFAVTTALRRFQLPALVTLLVGGAVLVGSCALSIWRLPGVFLGPDGQWMADTMRNFLRKVRRTEGRPKLSGAFEATGVQDSGS